MAVYLVNVYSLSDDFIKEFPGIIQDKRMRNCAFFMLIYM